MKRNTFKLKRRKKDKILEGQKSLQDKTVKDRKSHVLEN